MAWSVEATVLIWLSKRESVEYLDIAALSLFGLAVFKLLFLTEGAFAYSPIVEFTLLANHRALAFTVVSIAIAFSAFVVDGSVGKRKQTNSNILHSAWCAMLFFLVTAEMNDYFRFYSLNRPTLMMEQMSFFRILSFSVFWISLSIPFLWVGLKRRLVPPVVAALVVALLALVFGLVRGIAFDPIETFKPMLNIRTISLLMLGTGLLLQTQMIRRSAETFDRLNDIVKFIQVGIMIVVLVLLTGETRDYFQQDIVALAQQPVTDAAETSRLSNLQQLMLSGVWLVYSVALLSVGIWRKYRGMRFVAMALFGITILKIFLYDLSFLQTLYRLFSFIALGLMLLAVSWAYQRYKDVIFGKPE
jgi:hypothetical protein